MVACPSPRRGAPCRAVLSERTSVFGAQTCLLIGREQSAHLLLLPLRVGCNCKEELIELIALRAVCCRDCRGVGREGVGRGGGARQNQRVGVLVVQLAEEEGARPQGFVRAKRARLATGQEREARAQGDSSAQSVSASSARLSSAPFCSRPIRSPPDRRAAPPCLTGAALRPSATAALA